jgi:Immunity protein Imm1
MSYLVSWRRNEPEKIDGVTELDAVLERIEREAASDGPVVVGVYQQHGDEWIGMDVAAGHPQRAFVFATGTPGGYATEPGVEPWPADIVFDHGGTPTEYHPGETQMSPATARRVVREFVATGARLRCIRWDQ